jgi:hypothetical protein
MVDLKELITLYNIACVEGKKRGCRKKRILGENVKEGN